MVFHKNKLSGGTSLRELVARAYMEERLKLVPAGVFLLVTARVIRNNCQRRLASRPHEQNGHASKDYQGVAHPSWGFMLVEIVEKNSISEVVVFTPQNYD